MSKDLTPTITAQEETKSTGHLFFLAGYEYFVRRDDQGKDQLYRASSYNYVARDGYRAGARWIAPEHMINDCLFLLGVPANYKRQ